ncbi:GGDEF domain-containing protein [Geodermatophilus sp. DF01-2]|uniref:GGDEF domain-containing protein n=1 Tax=Geodermatophilus sp. DF01-2 TaxID=2559610 RepID=UPI0010744B00|nr:GGDEF domain-containing protein [Geodermatophilus sp. DF01_2]TFV58113.1 GGDEF domain-containing protein [Geodermatophilus sp. DF01_2]
MSVRSPSGAPPLRHRPTLAEDRLARARESALWTSALAVFVVPAWSGFDVLLEPRVARVFIAVRLGCLVPMVAAVWLLWRHPLGRRQPELLACAVLATVQAEIAWMVPRVEHVEFYLLGFTLAVYASGCLLVARPVWTGALVGVTWVAFGVAALTAPTSMPTEDLLAAAIYLVTASGVGVLAHHQRYRLATRESTARIRLEREQERTRALLTRLERLSHEDPLTGLANRRRWDAELAAACAAAREAGTPLVVVLVDVDRFKQVNDEHGHGGGDEALRLIAAAITSRVRAGDVVARLGGDELAVLLPGSDLGRAVALAEELRGAALRIGLAGSGPGSLTLSLGVAVASGDAAVPERLTAEADAHLYRAKVTRNAVWAGLPTPTAPLSVGRAAGAPAREITLRAAAGGACGRTVAAGP